MIKILVVDDDEVIRMFLTRLLRKRFEAEVLLAKNGREGLTQIREHRPDLVFLDVTMPVMNGVEMLEEVRQDADISGQAVVILTAIGEREIINDLESKGITDFVLKPLDYEGTTQRIRSIFEKIPAIKEKMEGGDSADRRRKVVVVSGEKELRDKLTDSLKDNYEVTAGETGADCLKLFMNLQPDFLVLDEKLEVISEKELILKLKDLYPGYKAKSLYLVSEEKPENNDYGFDEVIIKGEPDKIPASVKKFLQNSAG